MAVVLIVEDGTSKTDANAYISLADADTYHEERLHVDTWTASTSTDDIKNRGIVQATLLLDSLVNWSGSNVDDDQALRWPRDGVYTPDGDEVDNDSIPTFLKNATAEYTRLLIASDRQADPSTAGFKELRAGSLKMIVDKYDRVPVIPNSVWTMIQAYGAKASGQNRILERV